MLKDLLTSKKKAYLRITVVLWLLFSGFFIFLPVYFYSVSVDGFGLYGGMPSIKSLENPENDLSSELFSADGVSLGKYYRFNRSNVLFEDLSDELVATLEASEDRRFYGHSGMDMMAYMRVLKGILTFNLAGGGSTITQQLAKNLFTQNSDLELNGKIASWGRWPKRIVEKSKEWIIAVQLERNFTKKEIMAMYLNTVPFGSNAYGIKSASETFFNKTPDSLNLQESAVLIGLLQGVTRFSPVYNPDNSFTKRNEVLYKVFKFSDDYITSEESYDSLASMPLGLEYSVANHNKGMATYFRSVIKNDLMRWCKDNDYDLWEDGLKIYTTLDSRMQQYAEESIASHMAGLQNTFDNHLEGRKPWIDTKRREIKGFLKSRIKSTQRYRDLVNKFGAGHDSVNVVLNTPLPMTIFSWEGEIDTLMSPMDSLSYYKHFLNTGFMSLDPHTGSIKAWVGGIDHKFFKYDHVRQGRRQPGSTFKPFVYGAAIENGYNPCYTLPDVAVTFQVVGDPPTWTPPNSDGKYSEEMMTIRKAMANSINSITANLMKRIGPQTVVDFAHRVGIQSELDPVPALCLGTSDVSVFELTAAYSTFANEGIYTKPYFITRIEDKNGNVIQNFVPKTKQAISEETAYLMLHMLKGGVEESGGTSRGLSYELKEGNEIGGKTGTTNNASDGWYMGVTKDLVTGVWVGGDERSIHFRNWYMGQGGRTARPIWDIYMRKIYADSLLGYEKGPFKRPINGLSVKLDCDQYGTLQSDNNTVSDSTLVVTPVDELDQDDLF